MGCLDEYCRFVDEFIAQRGASLARGAGEVLPRPATHRKEIRMEKINLSTDWIPAACVGLAVAEEEDVWYTVRRPIGRESVLHLRFNSLRDNVLPQRPFFPQESEISGL